MGDEHLSSISETESDKVIKSSIEDLVPILSESEGILDNMCDLPFCDNSPPLDVLTDHFKLFSDFNDDCTSSDDDYFEDIDYVEASPPDSELVSLEEVKGEILRAKLLNIHLFIDKIESLNNNPTPDYVLKSPSSSFFSYSDNSFLEFETFSDHTKETSSGSTTTHADNSPPEYDSFLFEIEPDQGELASIVIEVILREPHIFDPGIFIEVQSEILLSREEFSISFIHDPLYPVFDTLLPFSFENEDTVFKPEGDILLLEAILNSEPLPPLPNHEQNMPSFKKELKVCEAKTVKSFVDKPPEVELKDLPPHLEYAFLEGDNKFPVIIAKELGDEALIKILMEEDYKPVVQHQRQVKPKIHDVIKKEVEKLLDAGLIYPISDSPGVSPVHCVPKKGGFTVFEKELIPTHLVTRWRVCIDYRKVNEATHQDHFPLPFMDQMLERLTGNKYYCFLDGFSGYFQIPIDPRDQEKTTFTCPYGMFAYRHMPFGLCNAPGTFQRFTLVFAILSLNPIIEIPSGEIKVVKRPQDLKFGYNNNNDVISQSRNKTSRSWSARKPM
nr:reverse transcriptase domain-containing protein [Tanacetum cinerariifolium]